jgi:hypothetical protein
MKPIVYVHPASVEYVTSANPHGWHPAIRYRYVSEFAPKLLAWADQIILAARDVDAEGVILWNCEGAKSYATLGFLGDPRLIRSEFAGFFKRFKAAGLKVGCTIRHTKIVDGIHVEPWDIVGELSAKVQAAKKLGCADYAYIDSNCDWLAERPIRDTFLRMVADAHPDTLLIPEWAGDYYDNLPCCKTYRQFPRSQRRGDHYLGKETICLFLGDDYAARLTDEQMAALVQDYRAGSQFLLRAYDAPETRVFREVRSRSE